MEFTKEQLEKAMAANSPAELLTLAKAEQIPLTEEEAEQYFASLHPPVRSVSDKELETVAGGASIPQQCPYCGFPSISMDNTKKGYILCRRCGYSARHTPVVF